MGFILGLDLGITSVGYGVIDESYNVICSGVRLFSEGTAENNAKRRSARGTRRRIRRRQLRLQTMRNLLCDILHIESLSYDNNIYAIRKKGLREKLTPEELVSAILHLTKLRGIHYLTAEDLESSTDGRTVSGIVEENTKQLGEKYVCELQLERLCKEGAVRGIENRYLDSSYRKELDALLDTQSEFYPQLESNRSVIMEIYESRRHFEDGPGSRKSPTPYGRFRYDDDGHVIEVNLIDLMRGHCTYYPDELRIAKSSYTACLFNLLNDLNNLRLDGGRKITYEEKQAVIHFVVDKGKSVTINEIAKKCGVNKELISGFRQDKNEKPIFTKFDGYQELYKICKEKKCTNFIEGKYQLVDEVSDILTKIKSVERRETELLHLDIPEDLAKSFARAKNFKAYHSLSKKAMDRILGDLWHTPKNQMQLFAEQGMRGHNDLNETAKEISINLEEWIVSPVTKRAVNEGIKVINALRKWLKKKYGKDEEFSDIVIELAREKNEKDQKRIKSNIQKNNENRKKKVAQLVGNRHLTAKQVEMLLLLDEQDNKCAYSLNPISISNIFEEGLLEIDHIIPRSQSFCDARYNKVVVYAKENQKKGQRTPFQYMQSGMAGIDYDTFKKWVEGNNKLSKDKKAALLYEGNPVNDLQGFINRNLVDTRYASRKFLNVLQRFFKSRNLPTRVKTINGAMTFEFRRRAQLSKDRLETYAHHAQDALIIAGFANTGIMRKLDAVGAFRSTVTVDEEDSYYNQRTGEVIEEADFKSPAYIQFIKYISNIESLQPLYSHKVDRKPNRQLYDENIKGTRLVTNEDGNSDTWYYVTKYINIYENGTNSSGKKLKELILKRPKNLLMYRNDYKTFEKLKEVVDYYKDEENPFYSYFKEHNEKIRKYSKKGNGPVVNDVKYLDKQVGSHRVNPKQRGGHQSVFLKIKSWRADIYKTGEGYKFINVTYDMLSPISERNHIIYKIDE